ncbi:MAG: hypothetical protein A3F26_02030 [Candidatus Ryanbacteria bacterium RIFCSPHIGHO2_12_FULL_47_12b]|uniref:D-alanine--D-alanine ligase n=2 Tax=Parcubacteria group TaxID=1794811 RepID=A0A1G2H4Z9_9BACT|nr:MAG: D-alanine-D-alanine ligase [Parcubacteria group bacterium GW2011_GWA2_47_10b]KKU76029.1 MAG: D-alanine-D-alanine ligase [Candidatus Giovannonibacteria bacterium GW2011_GWB1_47_6b]KKU85106.1 MAG: D-alanine-D-alanine ligase [Parcubacteria group bacterium GW2011_GWA1_47_9]OGZ45059.1 MAG: hypothetical protein A2844_02650 [Candidatus Ryanbacteria bacterium RIFCSPHIGHO2_01_FULL_48_80]OGZ48750.1 MAG: hypothetical protein A3C83_00645 [Candidatus Ryanbacteria bacterium RIFCSPHIGHO2_02_FULL_47_25
MMRVGVVMGGPSSEHDVSIMSGLNVLRALSVLGRHEAYPVYITQSGAWLFGDRHEWLSPTEAIGRVDVVFNALHGEYGEDGTIQQILDQHRIPYTGSCALPSAIAMNKEMAQNILEKRGLRMPKSICMTAQNTDTRRILELASPPWIIKPRSRGSSVGVSKVNTSHDLPDAIKKTLSVDTHFIAQEYIPGREVTASVLENTDGTVRPLAPIEIIPPENADFFDYQVKYNGKTKEVCPAEFYGAMAKRIQDVALEAHDALGLRHYSRTDMIIKPASSTRRAPEVYVLEVNTLPGLTSESLFPKAARHAGLEFPQLIDHMILLAKRG